MRPVWKGTISFGLVSIPISLVTAEKSTQIKFHLIDSKDSSRIRYQRVNDDTGTGSSRDLNMRTAIICCCRMKILKR